MAEQENNTTNRFNQLNFQQKMAVAVAVAALFALIAGMWMWEQTPDYRVLYSNLSDRDGGSIIESLQQMNIPYKFADGGGALMVPSNQVHEARLKLASQGLPKGGNVGFELMDNQKFGITQFAEQVNYQRALEGELARTVESIDSVAAARVHLAIPKPSVFIKEQQKPSASVVIRLQGGRLLDSGQISAIVHMISSSVPELSAKNVTVVDQNGTLLSASRDGGSNDGLDPTQLKYVKQVEQSYIDRINALLIPMYGANNVHAQVSADIDFARTEQTSEIYTPNPGPASQVIRSEQSSQSSNSTAANGGIPGALSNQPPAPAAAPIVAGKGSTAGANTATPSSQQKDTTINYEVDRTISHTIQPVGSIKRLSVAVVVNANRTTTDAKGKSIDKPLSDAEKEQINNLVKDAVGFDQKRGDNLNVQVAPFHEIREVINVVPLWKQPYVIELAKEAIKYLLIGIAMLFVIFGIIRPGFRTLFAAKNTTGLFNTPEDDASNNEAQSGAQTSSGMAPYEQSLQIARQIAQQEPKIVASVIKEWVKE
ncbi:MAG: flagellar basal-body MS-ring/collar protein FliF [Gallionella sp.]